MLKVGLTGGIGCGKSAACSYFTQLGVPVIDTDELARDAVTSGSECLRRIISEFGDDVQNNDGSLNREKLRNIVFSDKKQLVRLEEIIHPEIKALLKQKLAELNNRQYVLIAIPLLIEKNWNNEVDRILVIDCTIENQLQRASIRDGKSENSIRAIISNQVTRDERIAAADDVLTNNTTLDQLRLQVERIHLYYTQLSTSSKHSPP